MRIRLSLFSYLFLDLAILTYISSIPRWSRARRTQFLLMMTDEMSIGTTPEPIFLSAIHSL